MTTNPSPPARPTTPSSDKPHDQAIQTGALSGGQPGQGVDAPSSRHCRPLKEQEQWSSAAVTTSVRAFGKT